MPGRDRGRAAASLSADALARFDDRERRSAVGAVRSVLQLRSIAVIRASRRRETVGGAILDNVLRAQFNGSVYAVNSRAEVVQGLPAYRSVLDISASIDLAVVVVPARQVVEVAR